MLQQKSHQGNLTEVWSPETEQLLDMKHIEIFNLKLSIELLSQKSMIYDKPLQSF